MDGIGKINYDIKNSKIALARMYTMLGGNIVDGFLSYLIFFGFLSFSVIAVSLFTAAIPLVGLLAAKFFLFFGLLSLVSRIFIRRFLRSQESNTQIKDDDKKTSLNDVLSFEALLCFNGFKLDSPDMQILYKNLMKSNLVRFLIMEIDTEEAFINDIAQKLPQSLRDEHQLDIIFFNAVKIAEENNSRVVTTADIFWGYLKSSKVFEQLLVDVSLDESDIKNLIYLADSIYERSLIKKNITQKLKTYSPGIAESWAAGYTLALDRFSQDITPNSSDSFSVGDKTAVLKQIENILSKNTKNNCIITGPIGSGKTTLIREFAKRVFWGESIPELNHMRIVKIDAGAVIANAKNPSEMESIVRAIFSDAISAGNVILFIDDIHTLFSGGSKDGTVDVSEIILPFIENSSLKIIGVTTDKYYETYISSKASISGGFARIQVKPTEKIETIKILEDMSLFYTGQYGIRISYNAIKSVYQFAEGLSLEKDFPAKGIDLLDEVCSTAKNMKLKIIDKEAANKILADVTNLPVAEAGAEEKSLLINLEEKIKTRVIGQLEAVKAVASALKRKRTGADTEDGKPIGSFLFLGPTGVGKTELAKSLSWAYFNSAEAMIRMDMSEYQEEGSLDRFIGQKIPGKEELEGGDFVKKIRNNPFSVVLLDEAEKANPKILDLFLQILDEGYFTDGLGNRVVMKNSIIIATSNAGANIIREGVSQNESGEKLKEKVLEYVQSNNVYRPELLNRFDAVILFTPLTQEEIFKIATLNTDTLLSQYKTKGYNITVDEAAIKKMAQDGYDPEYGARPMKRVFQDKLENIVAQLILEEKIKKSQPYNVTLIDLYPEDNNDR